MNILMKTTGQFEFLDSEYNHLTFNDYNDIPDDISIIEIIKFLPDIPPPPHTVQQHEEIHFWNDLFKSLMEKTYATSN